MKKFRSFVALCLAMVMAFSFSAVAFAATPEDVDVDSFVLGEDETIVYQDDEMTIVETSATRTPDASIQSTDYNSVWVASSGSGNFRVYTSNTGTVGIILSVSSSSNNSSAYISVQKPNGDYFKNNVFLTPSQNDGEASYKIYFAQSGSYTIYYTAYTTVGMRIMCTIYK